MMREENGRLFARRGSKGERRSRRRYLLSGRRVLGLGRGECAFRRR